MTENPRRGRQARNFTTNVPKILDLKSSSEQIFFRKLSRLSVENYGLVRAAQDVMYFDRRHLLPQAFKEKLRRRNYP